MSMDKEFRCCKPDGTLFKLNLTGVEYFYRDFKETCYIVQQDRCFTFAKNKAFNRGLFLFGLVKKDFDKWLSRNPEPKFEDFYPPTRIKTVQTELTPIKYDIDHAYWRIAFLKGYISEGTYKHGIRLKNEDDAFKKLYCMALSVQGQRKVLHGYRNKVRTGTTFVIEKDPMHAEIYKDIRHSTHKIISDLADILWDDFLQYNVDCITFIRQKNCKKVESYFKKQNLTFKKL